MASGLHIVADFSFRKGSVAAASNSAARQIQGTLNNSINFDSHSLKDFHHSLGRITGRASEFRKSMDAATARVFAFGATATVLNAVSQSFRALLSSTIEVEKKLIEINSIMGASSQTFNKFRTEIFNVAKSTGNTFDEVAKGAAELARQGLSAEDTVKRLNAALILTRISGLDSAASVNAITAAINGFKTASLTANQIVNKLVAVDTAFAVSSKDLAEGFQRAGSTAEDASVSFDELLGIITAVQQKTARGGAVIGNALKSIFTRLSRSTTIDELKALGVEIDASQNGIQKLQALSRALESLGDSTQASKIKELAGGVYQINIVSAALKDLSEKNSLFAQATKKSSGATNEAFKKNEQLGKSLSSQLNELLVNITNIGQEIGKLTISPLIGQFLGVINKFLGKLGSVFDPETGNKFIQNFFKGIGTFISGPGVILIAAAFAKIFKLISKFATEGLGEVFKIGSETEKIKNIEDGIVKLLEKDEKLREGIKSSTGTIADKHKLIEDSILKENALLKQQADFINQIAKSIQAKGVYSVDEQAGFLNKRKKPIENFATGNVGRIKSNLSYSGNVDIPTTAGIPASVRAKEIDEARKAGARGPIKVFKSTRAKINDQPFVYNSQEEVRCRPNKDAIVLPKYGNFLKNSRRSKGNFAGGYLDNKGGSSSDFVDNFKRVTNGQNFRENPFIILKNIELFQGKLRGNLKQPKKINDLREIETQFSSIEKFDAQKNYDKETLKKVVFKEGFSGKPRGESVTKLFSKQVAKDEFLTRHQFSEKDREELNSYYLDGRLAASVINRYDEEEGKQKQKTLESKGEKRLLLDKITKYGLAFPDIVSRSGDNFSEASGTKQGTSFLNKSDKVKWVFKSGTIGSNVASYFPEGINEDRNKVIKRFNQLSAEAAFGYINTILPNRTNVSKIEKNRAEGSQGSIGGLIGGVFESAVKSGLYLSNNKSSQESVFDIDKSDLNDKVRKLFGLPSHIEALELKGADTSKNFQSFISKVLISEYSSNGIGKVNEDIENGIIKNFSTGTPYPIPQKRTDKKLQIGSISKHGFLIPYLNKTKSDPFSGFAGAARIGKKNIRYEVGSFDPYWPIFDNIKNVGKGFKEDFKNKFAQEAFVLAQKYQIGDGLNFDVVKKAFFNSKDGGVSGALQSGIGSAFQAAIESALSLGIGSRSKNNNFDVPSNTQNISDLRQIVGARDSVNDFEIKSGISTRNLADFVKKVLTFEYQKNGEKVSADAESGVIKNFSKGSIPKAVIQKEVSEVKSLGGNISPSQVHWGKGTIGGKKFVKNKKELEITGSQFRKMGINTKGDSAVIPFGYANGNIPKIPNNINDFLKNGDYSSESSHTFEEAKIFANLSNHYPIGFFGRSRYFVGRYNSGEDSSHIFTPDENPVFQINSDRSIKRGFISLASQLSKQPFESILSGERMRNGNYRFLEPLSQEEFDYSYEHEEKEDYTEQKKYTLRKERAGSIDKNKNLNIDYLSSAKGNPFFDIITGIKTGEITQINGGHIIGEKIPSVLIKLKKLVEKHREKNPTLPNIPITGFFEPKFLTSRIGDRSQKEIDEYYSAMRTMGINPFSANTVNLQDIFSEGFASGHIPNFSYPFFGTQKAPNEEQEEFGYKRYQMLRPAVNPYSGFEYNQEIGYINYKRGKRKRPYNKVLDTYLNEKERGKKIGIGAYDSLIKESLQTGDYESDDNVSFDAARVYAKLSNKYLIGFDDDSYYSYTNANFKDDGFDSIFRINQDKILDGGYSNLKSRIDKPPFTRILKRDYSDVANLDTIYNFKDNIERFSGGYIPNFSDRDIAKTREAAKAWVDLDVDKLRELFSQGVTVDDVENFLGLYSSKGLIGEKKRPDSFLFETEKAIANVLRSELFSRKREGETSLSLGIAERRKHWASKFEPQGFSHGNIPSGFSFPIFGDDFSSAKRRVRNQTLKILDKKRKNKQVGDISFYRLFQDGQKPITKASVTHLNAEYRGQGIGQSAYEALINNSLQYGDYESDNSVSFDAARTYARLTDRFPIGINNNLTYSFEKEHSLFRGGDNPVFKINQDGDISGGYVPLIEQFSRAPFPSIFDKTYKNKFENVRHRFAKGHIPNFANIRFINGLRKSTGSLAQATLSRGQVLIDNDFTKENPNLIKPYVGHEIGHNAYSKRFEERIRSLDGTTDLPDFKVTDKYFKGKKELYPQLLKELDIVRGSHNYSNHSAIFDEALRRMEGFIHEYPDYKFTPAQKYFEDTLISKGLINQNHFDNIRYRVKSPRYNRIVDSAIRKGQKRPTTLGAARTDFSLEYGDLPTFSSGFVPNFADEILKDSGSKLKINRGTLNVGLLKSNPSEGKNPLRPLLRSILSGEIKNINGGDVVGPTIPNILMEFKDFLDGYRKNKPDFPRIPIRGFMKPSELTGRLNLFSESNVKSRFDKTSALLAAKGIVDNGKIYRGTDYYTEEDKQQYLTAMSRMGVDPTSDEVHYLEKIFPKGFSGGYVPNFAKRNFSDLTGDDSYPTNFLDKLNSIPFDPLDPFNSEKTARLSAAQDIFQKSRMARILGNHPDTEFKGKGTESGLVLRNGKNVYKFPYGGGNYGQSKIDDLNVISSRAGKINKALAGTGIFMPRSTANKGFISQKYIGPTLRDIKNTKPQNRPFLEEILGEIHNRVSSANLDWDVNFDHGDKNYAVPEKNAKNATSFYQNNSGANNAKKFIDSYKIAAIDPLLLEQPFLNFSNGHIPNFARKKFKPIGNITRKYPPLREGVDPSTVVYWGNEGSNSPYIRTSGSSVNGPDIKFILESARKQESIEETKRRIQEYSDPTKYESFKQDTHVRGSIFDGYSYKASATFSRALPLEKPKSQFDPNTKVILRNTENLSRDELRQLGLLPPIPSRKFSGSTSQLPYSFQGSTINLAEIRTPLEKIDPNYFEKLPPELQYDDNGTPYVFRHRPFPHGGSLTGVTSREELAKIKKEIEDKKKINPDIFKGVPSTQEAFEKADNQTKLNKISGIFGSKQKWGYIGGPSYIDPKTVTGPDHLRKMLVGRAKHVNDLSSDAIYESLQRRRDVGGSTDWASIIRDAKVNGRKLDSKILSNNKELFDPNYGKVEQEQPFISREILRADKDFGRDDLFSTLSQIRDVKLAKGWNPFVDQRPYSNADEILSKPNGLGPKTFPKFAKYLPEDYRTPTLSKFRPVSDAEKEIKNTKKKNPETKSGGFIPNFADIPIHRDYQRNKMESSPAQIRRLERFFRDRNSFNKFGEFVGKEEHIGSGGENHAFGDGLGDGNYGKHDYIYKIPSNPKYPNRRDRKEKLEFIKDFSWDELNESLERVGSHLRFPAISRVSNRSTITKQKYSGEALNENNIHTSRWSTMSSLFHKDFEKSRESLGQNKNLLKYFDLDTGNISNFTFLNKLTEEKRQQYLTRQDNGKYNGMPPNSAISTENIYDENLFGVIDPIIYPLKNKAGGHIPNFADFEITNPDILERIAAFKEKADQKRQTIRRGKTGIIDYDALAANLPNSSPDEIRAYRDELIEEAKLQAKDKKKKLLFLFGVSGSGKSHLAKGGRMGAFAEASGSKHENFDILNADQIKEANRIIITSTKLDTMHKHLGHESAESIVLSTSEDDQGFINERRDKRGLIGGLGGYGGGATNSLRLEADLLEYSKRTGTKIGRLEVGGNKLYRNNNRSKLEEGIVGTFNGSFSPFHTGHYSAIQELIKAGISPENIFAEVAPSSTLRYDDAEKLVKGDEKSVDQILRSIVLSQNDRLNLVKYMAPKGINVQRSGRGTSQYYPKQGDPTTILKAGKGSLSAFGDEAKKDALAEADSLIGFTPLKGKRTGGISGTDARNILKGGKIRSYEGTEIFGSTGLKFWEYKNSAGFTNQESYQKRYKDIKDLAIDEYHKVSLFELKPIIEELSQWKSGEQLKGKRPVEHARREFLQKELKNKKSELYDIKPYLGDIYQKYPIEVPNFAIPNFSIKGMLGKAAIGIGKHVYKKLLKKKILGAIGGSDQNPTDNFGATDNSSFYKTKKYRNAFNNFGATDNSSFYKTKKYRNAFNKDIRRLGNDSIGVDFINKYAYFLDHSYSNDPEHVYAESFAQLRALSKEDKKSKHYKAWQSRFPNTFNVIPNFAIPNFADALQAAIGREAAALGGDTSKIRVQYSSSIQGPRNPMGAYVTNTRDEPRGFVSAPSLRAGRHLHTPNFATFDETRGGKVIEVTGTEEGRDFDGFLYKWDKITKDWIRAAEENTDAIKKATRETKSIDPFGKTTKVILPPTSATQKVLTNASSPLGKSTFGNLTKVALPPLAKPRPISSGQRFSDTDQGKRFIKEHSETEPKVGILSNGLKKGAIFSQIEPYARDLLTKIFDTGAQAAKIYELQIKQVNKELASLDPEKSADKIAELSKKLESLNTSHESAIVSSDKTQGYLQTAASLGTTVVSFANNIKDGISVLSKGGFKETLKTFNTDEERANYTNDFDQSILTKTKMVKGKNGKLIAKRSARNFLTTPINELGGRRLDSDFNARPNALGKAVLKYRKLGGFLTNKVSLAGGPQTAAAIAAATATFKVAKKVSGSLFSAGMAQGEGDEENTLGGKFKGFGKSYNEKFADPLKDFSGLDFSVTENGMKKLGDSLANVNPIVKLGESFGKLAKSLDSSSDKINKNTGLIERQESGLLKAILAVEKFGVGTEGVFHRINKAANENVNNENKYLAGYETKDKDGKIVKISSFEKNEASRIDTIGKRLFDKSQRLNDFIKIVGGTNASNLKTESKTTNVRFGRSESEKIYDPYNPNSSSNKISRAKNSFYELPSYGITGPERYQRNKIESSIQDTERRHSNNVFLDTLGSSIQMPSITEKDPQAILDNLKTVVSGAGRTTQFQSKIEKANSSLRSSIFRKEDSLRRQDIDYNLGGGEGYSQDQIQYEKEYQQYTQNTPKEKRQTLEAFYKKASESGKIKGFKGGGFMGYSSEQRAELEQANKFSDENRLKTLFDAKTQTEYGSGTVSSVEIKSRDAQTRLQDEYDLKQNQSRLQQLNKNGSLISKVDLKGGSLSGNISEVLERKRLQTKIELSQSRLAKDKDIDKANAIFGGKSSGISDEDRKKFEETQSKFGVLSVANRRQVEDLKIPLSEKLIDTKKLFNPESSNEDILIELKKYLAATSNAGPKDIFSEQIKNSIKDLETAIKEVDIVKAKKEKQQKDADFIGSKNKELQSLFSTITGRGNVEDGDWQKAVKIFEELKSSGVPINMEMDDFTTLLGNQFASFAEMEAANLAKARENFQNFRYSVENFNDDFARSAKDLKDTYRNNVKGGNPLNTGGIGKMDDERNDAIFGRLGVSESSQARIRGAIANKERISSELLSGVDPEKVKTKNKAIADIKDKANFKIKALADSNPIFKKEFEADEKDREDQRKEEAELKKQFEAESGFEGVTPKKREELKQKLKTDIQTSKDKRDLKINARQVKNLYNEPYQKEKKVFEEKRGKIINEALAETQMVGLDSNEYDESTPAGLLKKKFNIRAYAAQVTGDFNYRNLEKGETESIKNSVRTEGVKDLLGTQNFGEQGKAAKRIIDTIERIKKTGKGTIDDQDQLEAEYRNLSKLSGGRATVEQQNALELQLQNVRSQTHVALGNTRGQFDDAAQQIVKSRTPDGKIAPSADQQAEEDAKKAAEQVKSEETKAGQVKKDIKDDPNKAVDLIKQHAESFKTELDAFNLTIKSVTESFSKSTSQLPEIAGHITSANASFEALSTSLKTESLKKLFEEIDLLIATRNTKEKPEGETKGKTGNIGQGIDVKNP